MRMHPSLLLRLVVFKAFAGMGDSFLCACGWVALDGDIIADVGREDKQIADYVKGCKVNIIVQLGTTMCVKDASWYYAFENL